jgi:hypothetical protein
MFLGLEVGSEQTYNIIINPMLLPMTEFGIDLEE